MLLMEPDLGVSGSISDQVSWEKKALACNVTVSGDKLACGAEWTSQ